MLLAPLPAVKHIPFDERYKRESPGVGSSMFAIKKLGRISSADIALTDNPHGVANRHRHRLEVVRACTDDALQVCFRSGHATGVRSCN